jgi:CHAT domain
MQLGLLASTSLALIDADSTIGEALRLTREIPVTHVVICRTEPETLYYLLTSDEALDELSKFPPNKSVLAAMDLSAIHPTEARLAESDAATSPNRCIVIHDHQVIGFFDATTRLPAGRRWRPPETARGDATRLPREVNRSDDDSAPYVAFGLLACPERVTIGESFELTAGLSRNQPPGVAGPPLDLPDQITRPYGLTLQIIAPGFSIRQEESWSHTINVSLSSPYPTVTLHLIPNLQPQDCRVRKIKATYSADGLTLGFATRYVTVQDPADPTGQSHRSATASAVRLTSPAGTAPADLTVMIYRHPDSTSKLLWHFQSPHPLSIPDHPLESTIGDTGTTPELFARSLITDMGQKEGKYGVYRTLIGKGRRIARAIPTEFWDLLRAVSQGRHSPPTLLLLSEEPYVPWELAVLDVPLDRSCPPFLSAQACVGRWTQPEDDLRGPIPKPIQPPPTILSVEAMVVVAGEFGVPGWPHLPEATAELQDLQHAFRAIQVDADLPAVLACFDGNPKAHILHFAMHGQFDPGGALHGIIILNPDTGMPEAITPDVVMGSDLRHRPFVFLNACQLGQSEEVLGDYAGLAAAFLYSGASGVIAPLWSIADDVARQIALSVYERILSDGLAPAEAMRAARSSFAMGDVPQSSAFMAYQFFGHPALLLSRLEQKSQEAVKI